MMGSMTRCLMMLLCLMCSASWGRTDIDTLVTQLERARQEQGVAGVSFALVTHDKVLWKGGLGVMDWNTGAPVGEDTVFRIGSLTKIFTSAVLLRLQEEGRLKLTDRVRLHAPGATYTNPWENNHPITIAHLLEHTSGLQDLSKEEFDNSDPKPLTLEEGLALRPESRTMRWKPGLHASYSNSGYGLAGYVIEQATGNRYEEEVRARLFDPLGMASSGFFQTDATRARLATGYQPDGRTVLRYWHMIMRPFGGIHSTARDMGPFLQMVLNRGRHGERALLSPESMRRAELPTTTLAARSGLVFGYGLGIYSYFRRGILLRGHSGDADGYLSFFAYSRELDLAYFLSVNRFHWPSLRALRRVVEDWMVDGQPRPQAPSAKIPEDMLREYIGSYEPATSRFPMMGVDDRSQQIVAIVLLEGALYTQTAGGSKQVLIPVSNTHFRREDESEATCAFVRDEDGTLYFQEDDNYVKVLGASP